MSHEERLQWTKSMVSLFREKNPADVVNAISAVVQKNKWLPTPADIEAELSPPLDEWEKLARHSMIDASPRPPALEMSPELQARENSRREKILNERRRRWELEAEERRRRIDEAFPEAADLRRKRGITRAQQ